jgi:hypothetical protein
VYTTVTAGIVDIFVRGDVLSKDFLDVDEDEDKMTSAAVIAGLSISPVKNLKIGPNFQLKIPENGSMPNRSTIYVNAQYGF